MIGTLEAKTDCRAGLSRSEIESLCMLHAIGRDGCELSELPEKLGLSPALAEPVAAAVQPLITDGLVDVAGAQVELTVEGRSKLRRLCPRKTPSAACKAGAPPTEPNNRWFVRLGCRCVVTRYDPLRRASPCRARG